MFASEVLLLVADFTTIDPVGEKVRQAAVLPGDAAALPAILGLGRLGENPMVFHSIFSSLKTERIARKIYRTRNQAIAEMFDYIERFYNPTRRHSTLGHLSPIDFERQADVA